MREIFSRGDTDLTFGAHTQLWRRRRREEIKSSSTLVWRVCVTNTHAHRKRRSAKLCCKVEGKFFCHYLFSGSILFIYFTHAKKKIHHTQTHAEKKKSTKFAHAKRAQTIAMIIDEMVMIVWRASERGRAREWERKGRIGKPKICKHAPHFPRARSPLSIHPLGFFFSNCQKKTMSELERRIARIRERRGKEKEDAHQLVGPSEMIGLIEGGDRIDSRPTGVFFFFFLGFVCEFFLWNRLDQLDWITFRGFGLDRWFTIFDRGFFARFEKSSLVSIFFLLKCFSS